MNVHLATFVAHLCDFCPIALPLFPWPPATGPRSPVEESMSTLTDAVYQLVKLYLRFFCPPSLPLQTDTHNGRRDSRDASGNTEHLKFTVFAVHGVPAPWVSR